MIYKSTISSKGQITVPKAVRERLRARPGDTLVYEVSADDTVTLRRLEPFDAAFHEALSATLDEWSTAEDDAAFRDL